MSKQVRLEDVFDAEYVNRMAQPETVKQINDKFDMIFDLPPRRSIAGLWKYIAREICQQEGG